MCVCLASRYPRCLGAPQAGGHRAPAACSPCRARPCPPPTPQIPHQPRVSSSRPFPAKPNIGGGGAAAPPARSYPPKMSLGFTGTRGSAQGLPGAPLSPSTSLPSQGARALPGAPKFPSRGGAEAPPVPAGLGEGLASHVCSPQGLGGATSPGRCRAFPQEQALAPRREPEPGLKHNTILLLLRPPFLCLVGCIRGGRAARRGRGWWVFYFCAVWL